MTERIHQPCTDCGSSDALQVNEDYTYCHSCKKYKKAGSDNTTQQTTQYTTQDTLKGMTGLKRLLSTGDYKGCSERGITGRTMKTYGALIQGDKVHFPYYAADDTAEPVAVKTRFPDKKFPIAGDFKKASLFGQQLFPKGGKYILVTEGEYDALAAYQMQGSKYPAVSIRNGASAALKDCKDNYEYLDSFEWIIIDFDSDVPGQTAAKEVAELFGGKSKIMKHGEGFKDACDYLAQNKVQDYNDAFWRADRFVPDGIVAGVDLWDAINAPVHKAELMYPFESINTLTYGIRQDELVVIAAGSGVGKSQFIKEIVYKAINETKDNIGLLMLEESNQRTGKGLVSLALNKPIDRPDVESTEEERREAYERTVGCGRVFMFNHFGSTGIDNIIARVRYMIKALDCRYVVLDHITMVVSSQENADERKALDEIMTKLRMLVSETGVSMMAISHLRRPEGKGHEEGGSTSLSQLRGSASIAQLSDIVIGLERNGQHEDPYERNTTYPRVLKNRYSGETGKCSGIYYDRETSRMNEIKEEDVL